MINKDSKGKNITIKHAKFDLRREFIMSFIAVFGLYLALYGQFEGLKNTKTHKLRILQIETQKAITEYFSYGRDIRENKKELCLKWMI